ncbi:MAG: S-adenosylmethionine decarboxylase [Nitrospirae bacterium]|nr:MAG: S-adenosylmethionine decarboxylase [Nitrospirota bacterium]
MYALGKHLLVELKDCNPEILKNLDKVKNAMVSAAKKARATIIDVSFHEFSPFGISGMVVIAESHLSIHTWPEYGYAAVDIFTCGDIIKPEAAAQFLIEKFRCKNPSVVEMKRGIISCAGNERLPYKVQSADLKLVAGCKTA